MAKKKKTIVKEIVVEEPKKTTNNSNLTYAGKVTIKVLNGKKILNARTYHNAGTTKLFNFFYQCLQGDFATASSNKPNKIMLFYNPDETPDPAHPKYDNKILTSYSVENALATIESGKVILHFLVPFSKILASGGSATQVIINQIALYNKNTPDDSSGWKDPCAYYLLMTSSGEWDPLIIDPSNNKLNLILEWEMSISNKEN